MKDVAERAGVSQPTVSLVLGDNPEARVADETRERVVRVARELGYRPNLVARGLVRQRSYALGIVVPDLSNPFFADVVSGCEKVAAEEGFAVLLCETRHTPLERHLEELKSRMVDGVILDAVEVESVPEAALDDLNAVLVDEPYGRWPGVASDAEGVGELAAEHLLSLDHRSFALLGPAHDVHGFRLRERGFVRRLAAADLDLPSERLRRVPPTVAGGREGMRALLDLPQRPTAVFCANDLLAVGALKECLASGVAIPDEISLVGSDDIELARVVTPELTTVAVPAREMGARAARLLVRGLEGETERPTRPRPLDVHLVVRDSTGPRPEAAA
jgi:LacI family transcriptional regulator